MKLNLRQRVVNCPRRKKIAAAVRGNKVTATVLATAVAVLGTVTGVVTLRRRNKK